MGDMADLHRDMLIRGDNEDEWYERGDEYTSSRVTGTPRDEEWWSRHPRSGRKPSPFRRHRLETAEGIEAWLSAHAVKEARRK